MLYRILTKNGVDNTNIDGARNYNFNAGRRSGIVKGALNGGNFFASNNNTIALDTCELRLCGHRIVLDAVEYKTLLNIPSVPIRYSMIAQVIVDDNNDVSFDLIIQSSSTPLVQENLDTTGKGKFQLEIGRFTQLTDGTITDVVRTADLITGGVGDDDAGEVINIGNVKTNTLDAGMEAEVDIENRYSEEEKKTYTDFTFSIPKGDQGIKGEKGDQGFQGVKGEKGDKGDTGATPNITATATTLPAGSEATVTKSGTAENPAFAFGIPKGDKGDKGEKGEKGDRGDTGATPNITATATTLPAGSEATVTKSGTAENPAFAFGIPKGDTGPEGPAGPKGDTPESDSELSPTSTNPVQNKVLYSPVTFAESERQKSKNLLDNSTLKTGAYLFVDGTYQNLTEYVTFEPISVTPNSTITVSCPNFVSRGSSGFVFFKDGVFVSGLDSNVLTATVPATANQVIYNFNMTDITLDKVQNAQLEYGSVATDYQPYNGAIVHEKNITDVEHIETIYEMNTKNTIGGTAYTAGIPFSNISISNVDFNKYKYLRFTCRWNYHLNNWFGGTITFDLDLQTPYNIDSNYLSVISNRPSYCFANDGTRTIDLVGRITVNGNKSSLSVNGYKITYTGEKTDYTSNNYLPYFRIEKIEGVR